MFEEADAVFGSRFMSGGYKRALFFRHALGNKLLTFLCDLVCDLNLTDMETCYKMVRADLLKSIPLESSTFDVEPELAIKLAKRGGRIFEVPISYSGRTYLEGKKIGWKDGCRALWAIAKYAISDRILRGGRERRRNSGAAEPRTSIHGVDGRRDSSVHRRARDGSRSGHRQYVRAPDAAHRCIGRRT